jgi:hypothetical protein
MIPSPPTQLTNLLAKPAHCPASMAAIALAGVAAMLVYRYGEHRRAEGYMEAMQHRCTARRRR